MRTSLPNPVVLLALAFVTCKGATCDTVCCSSWGRYFAMSEARCKEEGVQVDVSYCDDILCCEGTGKPFLSTISECAFNGGFEVDMDECDGVCCQHASGGHDVLPLEECTTQGGVPTGGEGCMSETDPIDTGSHTGTDPDVCCYLDGGVTPMPSSECEARGGRSYEDSDLCGAGGNCVPPTVSFVDSGALTMASVTLDPTTCGCAAVAPGSFSDLMYFALYPDGVVFASKGPGYTIEETIPSDIEVTAGLDINSVPLNTPVSILFNGYYYGIWAKLDFVATTSGLSGVSVTCW